MKLYHEIPQEVVRNRAMLVTIAVLRQKKKGLKATTLTYFDFVKNEVYFKCMKRVHANADLAACNIKT
jgi:hypothetical protein